MGTGYWVTHYTLNTGSPYWSLFIYLIFVTTIFLIGLHLSRKKKK